MMAEPFEAGQAPEPGDLPEPVEPGGADDVIDGTVVPFPRQRSAEVEPKRKPGGPGELRPIIPEHLRSLAGIRKAARWRVHRWRHISLYHLVRMPKRLVLTLIWAALGVLQLEYVQVHWWWVIEQSSLRSEAVRTKDSRTWESLHKHARKVRLTRGMVLLAEHVTILIAAGTVTAFFPLGWIPVGCAVIPVLAWFGNPTSTPVVDSATTPVAYEALSMEIVIRALLSLSIANINRAWKDNPKTAFQQVDPIARDGQGWLAKLDLPYGVTAGEVSEKREELASGLRRPLGTVWPETDHKRHPGALALYVADQDMTTAEQPAWPLAKRGQADVFAPVVFGTDPRGRSVTLTLMFASVIIGSIPRMGKTFLLRLLLLICALDIRVEIHAYDFKGTGDLKPIAQVAHRYRAGDEPEDIDYLLADMRALQREMRRRTKVIRDLDEKRCPENKVTPELAADRRLGLHPIAIAWDECQIPFEHPEHGKELIAIATDLDQARSGPGHHADARHAAAGRQLDPHSYQRERRAADVPEGDGPGRERHGARHLDVQERLPRHDVQPRGQGRVPVRRRGPQPGHHARLRVRHGTVQGHLRPRPYDARGRGRLTGYALGEDADGEVRSIANDVLLVFRDDPRLYTETIAEAPRVAPGVLLRHHARSRPLPARRVGVVSKKVREPGGAPRAGFERVP